MRGWYRAAVASMDRRVEVLVQALPDTGHWEDALFTLNSDHGRAFTEHGRPYHGLRVDGPVIRVPLWLKSPNGRAKRGHVRESWVGLIDVHSTTCPAASMAPAPHQGRGLLSEARQTGPVFAVSDGAIRNSKVRSWASDDVMDLFDPIYVADHWAVTRWELDCRSNAFSTSAAPSKDRSAPPSLGEPTLQGP